MSSLPRILAGTRAVVALAGLAVASYLVSVKLHGGRIACPTGGCEQVQSSPYAELFGVALPWLGAVSWLTLLVLIALGGRAIVFIECAVATAAATFAVYLLGVQLFVLHHLCVWCAGNDSLVILFACCSVVRLYRDDQPQD